MTLIQEEINLTLGDDDATTGNPKGVDPPKKLKLISSVGPEGPRLLGMDPGPWGDGM